VPRAVGLSTELVYLVTVATLTVANFLLFRNVVFHRGEGVGAGQPNLTGVARGPETLLDVGSESS
jgi:hypothetical protein